MREVFMHNCEEFRERITERIIDREELTALAEFQSELIMCSSCSEFYGESREMIEALSSVDLSISETQWDGIEYRLQRRIHAEEFQGRTRNSKRRIPGASLEFPWGQL